MSILFCTSFPIWLCILVVNTTYVVASLWLRLNCHTPKNLGAYWYQWISHKIEKNKILGPFWSCKLKSTANLAHLSQNWAKLAKPARASAGLPVAPKLSPGFFFSIAMGANYSFYVKSIATYLLIPPHFWGMYNNSVLAIVACAEVSFINLLSNQLKFF